MTVSLWSSQGVHRHICGAFQLVVLEGSTAQLSLDLVQYRGRHPLRFWRDEVLVEQSPEI